MNDIKVQKRSLSKCHSTIYSFPFQIKQGHGAMMSYPVKNLLLLCWQQDQDGEMEQIISVICHVTKHKY